GRAAPGWAWRSSTRSSRPTAAPSPATAGRARGPPSASPCRSPPKVRLPATPTATRGCRAEEDGPMANDANRPPPEHFLRLIQRQQRGRLKIYLGFAAGVGKTYEMLQEAHRLKRQGVDVVVGVVETHGRAETAALVEGLERVPRRKIEYKGV